MKGFEVEAQAYDELSKPKFESGSKFVGKLNLSPGDKVGQWYWKCCKICR